MLNLTIKTIPHKDQRYPTSGNYGRNVDGSIWIEISDLRNPTYELAVALHEIIESHLCEIRGINWKDIDSFDIDFERNRKKGNSDEPGDNSSAPYQKEHRFAENIERQFIHECGINWDEYSKKINELS